MATSVPHSSRVKGITARWVTGSWPAIAQERAKAAALRAMLPWVALIAEERRGSSRAATLRARALTGLALMDAVYRRAPRFLEREQAERAQAHCLDALQAVQSLTALFPNGPWRLTPKCHALMHLACDTASGNPRASHCYQDEDVIGRVEQLYTACHGKTAPKRSVERYTLGSCVAFLCRP